MLNYEVDPAVLAGRVPAGTELDLFQEKCFVSMVGFEFLETRVLGVPIPFHRNFDEVNLRFYVRRRVGEEVRRGVVFVKEIVPRPAIAAIARWVYGKKYVALPMSHRNEIGQAPEPRIAYRWKFRGRWNELAVRVAGEAFLAEEVSEEAFITEHYWGYAGQRDGGTVEYRVEHPRWKVWKAIETDFDCDVVGLYGEELAPFLSGSPSSAFLADGSEVLVRQGRRLASG